MKKPITTIRDNFQLSLNINDDDFINPPDPSQQNWTISRAMDELSDDLVHLDLLSKSLLMEVNEKKLSKNG